MAHKRVRSIIDTRKRKSSISNVGDGEDRSPPSARKRRFRDNDVPPSEKEQRCKALRGLIYPSKVPPDKFQKIEQLFLDRSNRITDLEDELEECKLQNGYLRRQLGGECKVKNRLNDKLSEQGNTAKEQQTRIEELEAHHDEQETAIKISSAMLQQAHEMREQQKQLLFEREARLETLNDRIYKMATALPGEAAQVALDAQAQRHLVNMQAMQADIAERDAAITQHEAAIESLHAEHADKLAAQEALTARRISAEVLGVRQRYGKTHVLADVADRRTKEAEQRAEAAAKRVQKLKTVTEDQKRLTERLMKENARLARQQT